MTSRPMAALIPAQSVAGSSEHTSSGAGSRVRRCRKVIRINDG